jgi:hypothetical protein
VGSCEHGDELLGPFFVSEDRDQLWAPVSTVMKFFGPFFVADDRDQLWAPLSTVMKFFTLFCD